MERLITKIIFITLSMGMVANSNATDLSTWERASVKIKSYPCQTKSPVYEGSGVIIDSNKVITSEHILMPTTGQSICYSVENDYIGNVKASVVRNDFESGLAELKLDEEVSSFPNLELDANVSRSSEIIALGYPKGSHGIQILEQGKVLTINGKRALIPTNHEMLEVSNLPVEYGMSGGILLSKDDNGYSYAGTLTHQFLKRSAGKQTKILSMSQNTMLSNQDLAIGIKAQDVLMWQKSTDVPVIQWKRELNSSNDELSSSMSFGPLIFNQQKIDSSVFAMGGADGVGIGGDDTDGDDDSLIGIEIKLNKNYLDNHQSTDLDSPILNRWYKWLLAGEKLTIVQVISDDSSQSITSFDQLVTLWKRDGYKPLVVRGNIGSLDTKMKELLAQTYEVKDTLLKLKLSSNDREVNIWLSLFEKKLLVLENNLGSGHDLEVFSHEYASDFWEVVYLDHFDEAIELEMKIVKLKEIFRKL
jgi:hypothetical protein